MKLLVHDPPAVSVFTPGWIGALDAGAQAPAGAAAKASAAAEHSTARTTRRIPMVKTDPPVSRIDGSPRRRPAGAGAREEYPGQVGDNRWPSLAASSWYSGSPSSSSKRYGSVTTEASAPRRS